VVSGSQIFPCNNDQLIKYFKTDLRQWSTDGDPYDDYKEATGVNMDTSVVAPGNDPLIPAEPDIRVRLNSFSVSPKQTISDSEGNSTTEAWSNDTTEVDMQAHTGSVEVSLSQTWKVGLDTGSETSVSVTAGYSGTHEWGKETTVSSSGETSLDWAKVVEYDASDAAALALNLTYENLGTATAVDVVPTFNIKLGHEIIATITPNYAAPLMAPNSTYGTVSVSKDKDNQEISIGIDALRAIQLGMPLTIEEVSVAAKVARWDSVHEKVMYDQDWNYYKNQIESRAATIVLESPLTGRKETKIAVNSAYYSPNVTLRDALIHGFDACADANGNVFVNGQVVDSNWRYYFSRGSVDTSQNILDMVLQVGDTVLIKNPGSASDKRLPEVLWANYTNDMKNVVVGVKEGTFTLGKVEAEVKANGQVITVPLVETADGKYYTAATSFSGAADSTYLAKVTVYDTDGKANNGEGNSALRRIDVLNQIGLYYESLGDFKEIYEEDLSDAIGGSRLSGNNFASFSSQGIPSTAEALVCQVVTENMSANNFEVKLNNSTKVNMGSGDAGLGRWVIELVDWGHKTYTIEGFGDANFSNISGMTSTEGDKLSHDNIDEIRIRNSDDIYVELYQHADYEGKAVGVTYTRDLGDFSFRNSLSSLKVFANGTEVSDEPSGVTFHDYNNSTNYREFTGSWNLSSVSNTNLSHDNVDRVSADKGRHDVWMTLYEHSNYGGYYRTFVNDTLDLWDNGGDFHNMLSSAKFKAIDRTKSGASYSPTNSKMVIVPLDGASNMRVQWESSEINSYADKNVAAPNLKVKVIGYYTKLKGKNGTKFFPYGQDAQSARPARTTARNMGDLWNNVRLSGTSNARAYMVKIRTEKISSNDIKFDVNGTEWHFGTSDTRAGGKTVGANKAPVYEQTIIVPASPYDASLIDITPTKSAFTRDEYSSKIHYEVVGYFSNEVGVGTFYQPALQPRGGIKPNVQDTLYFYYADGKTPKGYLVRIDNKRLASDSATMTINGQEFKIGNSATQCGDGDIPSSQQNAPNNSTIVYVKADPSHPTELDMLLNTGAWSTNNYWNAPYSWVDVEVLGFYY